VVVAIAVVGVREARAQTESAEALRAIELENAGKFREAIPIYRQAMRTQPTPIVVLGLERAYAELGMSDSLIAPLDTLLAKFPREPLYHVIHLRTFQILRRYDALRDAFASQGQARIDARSAIRDRAAARGDGGVGAERERVAPRAGE